MLKQTGRRLDFKPSGGVRDHFPPYLIRPGLFSPSLGQHGISFFFFQNKHSRICLEVRLIPTYGPLTNSGAAHSFLGFYSPNPHLSFCHLRHLIRVCANTLRFAQCTGGGGARTRSGQASGVRKNSDKAEFEASQELFFFFMAPSSAADCTSREQSHAQSALF